MENTPCSIPESGSAAMRGQMPSHPPPPQLDRNQKAATNSMPAVALTDSSYMQQISNPSSLGPNRSGANESANAKVAIPRQRSTVAPRYSRRVPRACETCRARKTKCSGDTPICRQCKELRVTCRYPVSWREKTKGYVVGPLCCVGLQLIRMFLPRIQAVGYIVGQVSRLRESLARDWERGGQSTFGAYQEHARQGKSLLRFSLRSLHLYRACPY
jgi:hypothetical protein